MKPKRHRPSHPRPSQLHQTPRIQTKQVTLPRHPIQDHTKQHPVVLFDTIGIRNEDGLSRRLSMMAPHLRLTGLIIELDDTVEEGRFPRVRDSVHVAVFAGDVGGVHGGEFGGEGFTGGGFEKGFGQLLRFRVG